jgi:uncharacterized membrane protein
MGTGVKKDRRLMKAPSGEILAFDHTEFRSSILPPPDELERYEALNQGTAKIILDTYVAQVNHRMTLEDAVIKGDDKRATRGQIIAGALGFVCIASGTVLAFLGKDVVGMSLIIGSIGTLLTAFYGGAIIRTIERTKKAGRR